MAQTDLIKRMKRDCKEGKITPFRLKVLLQLLKIPVGKVSTYALLAKSIDCGSSQAIGQALKHNPWAPEVPCHRIIKSDCTIGGFHGQTQSEYIDKKIRLLKAEGVKINELGQLTDINKIFSFN